MTSARPSSRSSIRASAPANPAPACAAVGEPRAVGGGRAASTAGQPSASHRRACATRPRQSRPSTTAHESTACSRLRSVAAQPGAPSSHRHTAPRSSGVIPSRCAARSARALPPWMRRAPGVCACSRWSASPSTIASSAVVGAVPPSRGSRRPTTWAWGSAAPDVAAVVVAVVVSDPGSDALGAAGALPLEALTVGTLAPGAAADEATKDGAEDWRTAVKGAASLGSVAGSWVHGASSRAGACSRSGVPVWVRGVGVGVSTPRVGRVTGESLESGWRDAGETLEDFARLPALVRTAAGESLEGSWRAAGERLEGGWRGSPQTSSAAIALRAIHSGAPQRSCRALRPGRRARPTRS